MYAWIINRDHLHAASPETFTSEVGTIGPRNVTPDQEAALHRGEGTAFRMRDDDGELYYSGRFLGDSESEEAFAPLDDFGTPNAGATTIEYYRAGKWEQI